MKTAYHYPGIVGTRGAHVDEPLTAKLCEETSVAYTSDFEIEMAVVGQIGTCHIFAVTPPTKSYALPRYAKAGGGLTSQCLDAVGEDVWCRRDDETTGETSSPPCEAVGRYVAQLMRE